MTKEACRISLIAIFGIICMTKGVLVNKDLGIEKDTYRNSNDDLTYNDGRFYDSIWNYDNANFGKDINMKQSNEKDGEHDYDKSKEQKAGNLISIKDDYNAAEKQSSLVRDGHEEMILGKTLADSEIVKRRQNYPGHFKPGKNPHSSYLHIKEPEMYIFESSKFNEDIMRKFTGPKKRYILPTCNKSEHQQSKQMNDASYIPLQLMQRKVEFNDHNPMMNLENSPAYEEFRKVRSQFHKSGFNVNDVHENNFRQQNKSPLHYQYSNHLNNADTEGKRVGWSKVNDLYSNVLNNKINENYEDVNSHHTEERNVSRNTNANKNQVMNYKVNEKMNTQGIETSVNSNDLDVGMMNNAEKIQKLCDKSVGNLTLFTSSIDELPTAKESVIFNNRKEALLQNLTEKIDSNSQSLLLEKIKNMGGKDLNLSPAIKIQNPDYKTAELNMINTELKHSPKNKVQISTTNAPQQSSPTADAITPNISYIYLQPVPVSNSLYLQKVDYSALTPNTSTENINKENYITANRNKSGDLITISIDPKTLENKVLHAEFFRKSEVKKAPDMLSIELSPKETSSQSNSSKIQKTISAGHPLQIATSVKNNTILITGGEKIIFDPSSDLGPNIPQTIINVTHENDKDRKENLQEEPIKGTQKENIPNDRNRKSISSMKTSELFNDNTSVQEEITQQNAFAVNGSDTNGLANIVIIQAKDKDPCQTDAGSCHTPTLCSLNVCAQDSPCKRTTMNLDNFKEIHEGLRESRYSNYNKGNKKNVKYIHKLAAPPAVEFCGNHPCPVQGNVKIKREAENTNISKLLNILKPIFVLGPKGDNEGSEDDTIGNLGFIDKVNLKSEPTEVSFEKGNKKVENKILEGFINSIIANYSRDEGRPQTKETTERNEEGPEVLFKLLENSMPKRNERENLEDKKSDIWNFAPILVPESSISKYGDSSEYTKLGPFDENVIKSFLKKDTIPFLQEENQG